MKKTINFMGVRNIAFAITALLTLLALFSWFYKGLNFGLDFTGGTLIELRYEQPADLSKIRQELHSSGFEEAVVQSFGATTDVLVRLPGDDPQLGQKVTTALEKASPDRFSLTRTEFVGPQVGEELRDQGGLGMLLALGSVLLYVTFRFQWKFAVGAILSLIHDVVVTLGLLSFFQITFDLTVLAAVLAIIGYSLNDTIVVFDRVRENFRVLRKASLIENINRIDHPDPVADPGDLDLDPARRGGPADLRWRQPVRFLPGTVHRRHGRYLLVDLYRQRGTDLAGPEERGPDSAANQGTRRSPLMSQAWQRACARYDR
ncbi:preprotein translocase SecF subunit [Pseudomonas psychrotolerans]|nr:preprotein translocase SecF subunit [Pseudomonas psychrotolerans]